MLDIIPIRSTGNKKKIVLLPFAGGYANVFYQYIDRFDKLHDLFAIEYPGRIPSSQPLTTTWTFHQLCLMATQMIGKIATPETCLLGISMGGYVGFKIAQFFETVLQKPLKHLYMLSVRDEPSLLSSLSSTESWYENFHTSISTNIDLELQKDIKTLMMNDRNILLTMKVDHSFLLKTPLTIVNGEKDYFCHTAMTKTYWQKKTMHNFCYETHSGGHIPTAIELNQFNFKS